MRFVEIIREAWRDIVVGTARASTVAVVLAGGWGLIVGFQSTSVAAAVRSAIVYQAAGAATIVQAADARIDARACAAVARRSGVIAAGALRAVEPTTALVLPRGSVPTYLVSAGFPSLLRIIEGDADHGGVLIAHDVALELGLRVGDRFPTDGGELQVGAVYAYPDDGRDPALSYAIIAIDPDVRVPFDACWVAAWPEDGTLRSGLRGTVLPAAAPSDGTRTTQLNQRLGERFVAPLTIPDVGMRGAGASFGAIVAFVAVRRRRLELGTARLLGVGIGAQAGVQLVENWVPAVIAASSAYAVAVVVAGPLPSADAAALLGAALSTIAASLGGTAVGVLGGVISIRSAAVQRYFRQR